MIDAWLALAVFVLLAADVAWSRHKLRKAESLAEGWQANAAYWRKSAEWWARQVTGSDEPPPPPPGGWDQWVTEWLAHINKEDDKP